MLAALWDVAVRLAMFGGLVVIAASLIVVLSNLFKGANDERRLNGKKRLLQNARKRVHEYYNHYNPR